MKRESLLHYSKIPYTKLVERSPRRRECRLLSSKVYAITAVILSLVLTILLLHESKLQHPQEVAKPIPAIPENFRTVGLVFYGRRSRVEILDCYLKVFEEVGM